MTIYTIQPSRLSTPIYPIFPIYPNKASSLKPLQSLVETSHREIFLLQGESLQACSPRCLHINFALVRNPFFKSQSSSWLVHPHVHFSVADSAPFAAVLASVSERPSDLCIYNLPILALDASQVHAQIRSNNHTHSNTYILNNTCIKIEMKVQNMRVQELEINIKPKHKKPATLFYLSLPQNNKPRKLKFFSPII